MQKSTTVNATSKKVTYNTPEEKIAARQAEAAAKGKQTAEKAGVTNTSMEVVKNDKGQVVTQDTLIETKKNKKDLLAARAQAITELTTGCTFRYLTSPNLYTCLVHDKATGDLVLYNHDGYHYEGNIKIHPMPKVWNFTKQSGRELTRTVVVFTPEELANMGGKWAAADEVED